ncbi:MAG: hypothetical protein WBA52_04515 [Dolichospermum sp.]
MKKFHKLLIITSVIGSIFGWNIHSTQAQNSPELLAIYQVPSHTEDIRKEQTILIAQSRTTYRCYRDSEGTTRLKPSIPGSVVQTGGCYIPVSSGRCLAHKGLFNFPLPGSPPNPSGFYQCTTVLPRIVEDSATGKKYYYLEDGLPGSSLTGEKYGTGVVLQK